MDQGNRDVSGIPVLDVGAALDVPHRDLQMCQMVDDALPVMLEPVKACKGLMSLFHLTTSKKEK